MDRFQASSYSELTMIISNYSWLIAEPFLERAGFEVYGTKGLFEGGI